MRLFSALLLMLISIISYAQTIRGKVISVVDGDTITLLDSTNKQIRVRLYGIDCPENGQFMI